MPQNTCAPTDMSFVPSWLVLRQRQGVQEMHKRDGCLRCRSPVKRHIHQLATLVGMGMVVALFVLVVVIFAVTVLVW